MEIACRERLDVLETVRRSREDTGRSSYESGHENNNLAPPLPSRPKPERNVSGADSLYTRPESHRAVSNGTTYSYYPDSSGSGQHQSSSSYKPPSKVPAPVTLAPKSPSQPELSQKTSRSSSPEKKGFPKTLRSGERRQKHSGKKDAGFAASKAAANAWSRPTPLGNTSPVSAQPAAAVAMSMRETTREDVNDSPGGADEERYSTPPTAPPHRTEVLSDRKEVRSSPSRPQFSSARKESSRYENGGSSRAQAQNVVPSQAPKESKAKSIPNSATVPSLSSRPVSQQTTPPRKPVAYEPSRRSAPVPPPPRQSEPAPERRSRTKTSAPSTSNSKTERTPLSSRFQRKSKPSRRRGSSSSSSISFSSDAEPNTGEEETEGTSYVSRTAQIMGSLPPGTDRLAAAQILHEVLQNSNPVLWDDVAGLTKAKQALKEAVVYPFLRPDLFRGLREPARGVLLFGPPGTGKTMLARAVATESGATFFSISASSLLSKWLGESERLVRALFALARVMAPSVVFVDEIDSLLSARDSDGGGGDGPGGGSGGGGKDNEATRRVKTEFLIQWSALSSPAISNGEEQMPQVLILAATNTPWALDPAARRRFVRRTYIPLPDPDTRRAQIKHLMGMDKPKHEDPPAYEAIPSSSANVPPSGPRLKPTVPAAYQSDLSESDLDLLVDKTAGYSGSDIAALARDAAMAPIRSLGEDKLLTIDVNEIRGVSADDWVDGMERVRASVGSGLVGRYEDWARDWGERGS
jgi:SpoVK/Ycf46/Vps4 family AAA+-type ATPase